jgi:hypothetical protein
MLPTRCGARVKFTTDETAGQGGAVRCVAEIPVAEDDLNDRMNRMRTWLDHQRVEPISFQLTEGDGGQVVRVVFKTENQATAFAAEFGGSVPTSVPADTAILAFGIPIPIIILLYVFHVL